MICSIYKPDPAGSRDLFLMKQMDRLHQEFPFASSRMLRDRLRLKGLKIGRERVQSLMRRMGIEALYRKPVPHSVTRSTMCIPICYGDCIGRHGKPQITDTDQVAGSPAWALSKPLRITVSKSIWMAEVVGRIMCLSNASGNPSACLRISKRGYTTVRGGSSLLQPATPTHGA